MGKLDNQVAIVMGASSGMGYATALAYAEEGAKVVVAGRRQAQIDDLAASIQGKGGQVLAKTARRKQTRRSGCRRRGDDPAIRQDRRHGQRGRNKHP